MRIYQLSNEAWIRESGNLSLFRSETHAKDFEKRFHENEIKCAIKINLKSFARNNISGVFQTIFQKREHFRVE